MILCFFNKSCEMAILLRSSETQRFLTVVHPTPPAGKKPTNFNWFVWINCIMWGRINRNKSKAHGAEAEQRDWSMSPRRGNRARHHCPDHQPQTRPATNAHARSLASRTLRRSLGPAASASPFLPPPPRGASDACNTCGRRRNPPQPPSGARARARDTTSSSVVARPGPPPRSSRSGCKNFYNLFLNVLV